MRWLKVVIFVDGKRDGSSCSDEKWRRFQCIMPESAYPRLKNAILNICEEERLKLNKVKAK